MDTTSDTGIDNFIQRHIVSQITVKGNLVISGFWLPPTFVHNNQIGKTLGDSMRL